MTPDQAAAMIEKIKKEEPAKLVAACNTIVLESITWAQQSLRRDQTLRKEIKAVDEKLDVIAAEIMAIRNGSNGTPKPANGATTAAPAGATATATPPPPPPRDGVRYGADGNPLSAAEAALEDEMDAATEGMAPHPGGAA